MFFSPVLTTFSFMNVVYDQAPVDWKTWGQRCLENTSAGEVPKIQCLEVVFANVVSVALALAGLALFAMLIIGGFKYLTSGGDPKAAEQAKNTLTYAILGLVIMVVAYLIMRFLENLTGLTLTKFVIPGP